MGSLILKLLMLVVVGAVVVRGAFYLAALLDLRVFGVEALLRDLARRRGGRLERGTFLRPYPPLAFELCGLPAVMQLVASGGVADAAQWLTLQVFLGPTGCPVFSAFHRPLGRLRQTVTTGDPVFDSVWVTVTSEPAIGRWLLDEDLRHTLLSFASRSAVPVTGIFAGLLRLSPRRTRKTIGWDGERIHLAEAFQPQSVAEMESFLTDAARVVSALRELGAR